MHEAFGPSLEVNSKGPNPETKRCVSADDAVRRSFGETVVGLKRNRLTDRPTGRQTDQPT
ncbi:unnamed protein product [Protopolystoma xenopodis]|uniref:Uncharacterized protein n=1 Tax=Protopolystoma xenopodis TaxID=117903 RepID=A0A448WRV7_9PLAT|nr:unnamed protein product [Protopolystoma xenopodis]